MIPSVDSPQSWSDPRDLPLVTYTLHHSALGTGSSIDP